MQRLHWEMQYTTKYSSQQAEPTFTTVEELQTALQWKPTRKFLQVKEEHHKYWVVVQV